MFVGRKSELREIVHAIDRAASGRGALFLLVGEPGVGKTRLADEACVEATRRGFRVAWGRAWEAGGAPGYFPWTEVLATVGRSFPESTSGEGGSADTARFRLFRGVVEGLRAVTREAPLVIVLDDVHGADLSSLRLLHFVARELRTLRVVILATRLDVDGRLPGEAVEALAQVGREGTVLPLRRLNEQETHTLVRATAGSIAHAVEDAIWRTTGGNPLFVDEVVRVLAASGGLARAPSGALPIPAGVRDAIAHRLGLVDDAARPLVEVAAVVGTHVDRETLADVLRRPPADLDRPLASALRAGVLVESSGGRFAFAHGLIRDVLYRDLPSARRAELHRAIADALEHQPRRDRSSLPEVAYHALAAAAVAPSAVAPRVVRAAERLLDSYAHEDALALLERGRIALESAGGAGADLATIWLALGSARRRVADREGARTAYLRAATLARSRGESTLLAEAALGLGADSSRSRLDPALRPLLEEALGGLPASEPALRARVLARLAAEEQSAGNGDRPVARGREAIAIARRLGDEPILLEVLDLASRAFTSAVDPAERLSLDQEVAALAARRGDVLRRQRAHLRIVFDLLERGDPAGADAYLDDVARHGTESGIVEWRVSLLRASRAVQEGRFVDADLIVQELRPVLDHARDPVATGVVACHRLGRLRAQGRHPEALGLEPEVMAYLARTSGGLELAHVFLAVLRAGAGDLAGARDHLQHVPEGSPPWSAGFALALLAETAVRLGDETRVRAALERLRPLASRWAFWFHAGFIVEGPLTGPLGLAAAFLGTLDEADAYLDDAVARAEAVGARPEAARWLGERAAVLARRARAGDAERAAELAARARAFARTLDLQGTPEPRPEAEAVRAPGVPSVPFRLLREGRVWTIEARGTTVRLPDSRGLCYLARLVAEPGREVHVLDLAGGAAVDGDGGSLLDTAARHAYRRRLEDLDDEIGEAERFADLERASRARTERELLAAELARALGRGGRLRRAGSAAERARVAVTRRLRETIRRIAEHAPELGRHLDWAVRTGLYCRYRPM